MTADPKYLTFEVEVRPQRIRLVMWPGGTLEEKYNLWLSTQHDDDYDDLISWVNDDIADSLDFYVEDVHL